jgi:hypothetical protein
VVTAFESVCCLACGSPYAKPTGRGTAAANPGCPVCGYLGWLPVTAKAQLQLRSGGDHRPQRFA